MKSFPTLLIARGSQNSCQGFRQALVNEGKESFENEGGASYLDFDIVRIDCNSVLYVLKSIVPSVTNIFSVQLSLPDA